MEHYSLSLCVLGHRKYQIHLFMLSQLCVRRHNNKLTQMLPVHFVLRQVLFQSLHLCLQLFYAGRKYLQWINACNISVMVIISLTSDKSRTNRRYSKLLLLHHWPRTRFIFTRYISSYSAFMVYSIDDIVLTGFRISGRKQVAVREVRLRHHVLTLRQDHEIITLAFCLASNWWVRVDGWITHVQKYLYKTISCKQKLVGRVRGPSFNIIQLDSYCVIQDVNQSWYLPSVLGRLSTGTTEGVVTISSSFKQAT